MMGALSEAPWHLSDGGGVEIVCANEYPHPSTRNRKHTVRGRQQRDEDEGRREEAAERTEEDEEEEGS